LQKGHTRPLASLMLFCALAAIVLIVSSVASTQSSASSRLRAAGPLVQLSGARPAPLLPGQTPDFFCSECFENASAVSTAQSGPDPDDNLTRTATATTEVEPCSSFVTGQNRIAFVSTGHDLDGDGLIDPELPEQPTFGLWLMRPDGSHQQRLVELPGNQREPAFDLGGRLLAYASNETGTYQIYTIDIRSGVIWQITTTPGNKRNPTWSSDSNWIAFQCDRNGNWDIFKIRSDGAGSEVPLAISSADEQNPVWSPTAPYIAYQVTEGTGRSRIYTMDSEGGNAAPVSDGGGDSQADDIDPAWHPQGQSLVFSSSRLTGPTDTTPNFNIWTMGIVGEVNGAHTTLITSRDANDTYDSTQPTWTPDLDQRARARIVFSSNRPGNATEADNWNIWATFLRDTLPPVLETAEGRENALPWLEVNQVEIRDDRHVTPGTDVTIKVKVYDKDSGVGSVTALLKDPDIKIFSWRSGRLFDSGITSDSQPAGNQALELDCQIVGTAELRDDGVAPDEVAGDGIYTGNFTTLTATRDYIIDIATTDLVGNSMTYDDIYGFTTVTFNPDAPVLFVDDYCEGQTFIGLTGVNNDRTAAFPVESYYRCNPGYAIGYQNTVDFDSIIGPAGYDPNNPFSTSNRGYYNVWRIICRGPVPAQILRNYLPTVEYQLDPAEALASPTTAKATRSVQVAKRAVIWAAPKTGNLWVANGTIMDAATQSRLANYLDQGGRLFISGDDLAWALTMGGRSSNAFLSNYLRAQYQSDAAGGYGFTADGEASSPVAGDAWAGVGGSHVNYWSGWREVADNPTELLSPLIPTTATSPCYCDAADHGVVWADGITPIGETKLYGYGGFSGTAAGTAYSDPMTGAHVVYLAFGFERIHRKYIAAHDPIPAHCANHRSHLIHNFLCWSRTGAFQGRVVSISEGGKPVTDPEPIVVFTQGEYRYAVRCQKDGTFVIQGVRPGAYSIRAIRSGYEIDHADGAIVHGGFGTVQVDFAIKEAQPGAIGGVVRSESTDKGIGNVAVRVYLLPEPEEAEGDERDEENGEENDTAPGNTIGDGEIPIEELEPPIATSVTAADGTFVIGGIPPCNYAVVADGTEVGYGTDRIDVRVTPGNATNVVLVLGAADGALSVHVTDDGDPPVNLANASVEVRNEADQIVATALTDTSGIAEVGLPAGTYQIRASRAGYQTSGTQGVTVNAAETASAEIKLSRVADGAISGKVASATTGQAVGDIQVQVLSGGVVIATGLTSGTLTEPGDGAPAYNYMIANVPAGDVVVRPIVSGYTPRPIERQVAVESGKTASGVSFLLDSLHVFPGGLQLMSLPWDYSNRDAAAVLDMAPGDLRMATWEGSSQRYRIYPNAPADRFRLGTGYWMNLAAPADLAEEGTAAPTVFEMPLLPGWNLIGTPYRNSVDFYSVSVRDQSGTVRTVQDALARNVLGSTPFAYMLGGYRLVSAFTPYTGYWLLANQRCDLIVDERIATLALTPQGLEPAVEVPSDGWLLPLQASVAGMLDTAAYIGVARKASTGFDPGLDQAKPPVPGMGSYVYLAFKSENQQQPLAVDFKAAGSSAQHWDLEVSTSALRETVQVSWPDMSAVPAGVQPVLSDPVTGKQVYMRTSQSYSYVSDGQPRNLRITVPAAEAGQLAVSTLLASAVDERAVVTYSLSKNAQVTAEVRNISGVLVRSLMSDQQQTAGIHSANWDGRNQSGVAVPNGRYLVRVMARTQDGQQSQALTQVSISR
jgi:Tol biopolymer transport system component